MRELIFLLIAISCVYANDDVQYIKSVKGGYGGGQFQYNAGANLISLFGNRTHHSGGVDAYGMRHNMTATVRNYEVGVCYVEVPTASLVKDPTHVPVGNGSLPSLSRIRTCCTGYIRNIHNYKICDPVCSKECVNSLCTAPEICTCFPDHVKNLAGFCIATCPIGCQNGQCAGGECICKDGYKLDSESKFCLPSCKENCGGIGNCTAPNTCECRSGYKSSPEGSCKPVCNRCINGDCVAPNECRCRQGYSKDPSGQCVPQCPQGCGLNGHCISPNVCDIPPTPVTSPTNQPGQQPYKPLYPNPYQQQPNQQQNQPYPGYQPNQPGYPSNQHNQPGYQPNQPGYQPNQPGYHSNQPNQPGYQPNQPGYQPNQPGYQPNQPGYQPNQPGYQPNQPGYHPNQPGHQPNQTGYPGYQPNSPYYVQPDQHSINPIHSENQQVPVCSEPCLNGVCVEGNRCSCNPGYITDRTDPTGFRCVPNCPGGCPNGVCSAPNFCICNMGYYKDHSVKGRPACVKRVRRSANEDNVGVIWAFEMPDYIY